MKFLRLVFILAALAVPSPALEMAAVSAVAAKFQSPSYDEQYQARIELNRLIDEATIPGKGDAAAVTKTLCAVLQDAATSQEAKKYLLRAMNRVATVDALDCLAGLLAGQDTLLKEEARQVLESIHDPKSVAVLERAMAKATDKRERIALAASLALQKSSSSVPLLAALAADADLEMARAGLRALAKIGGEAAVAALQAAKVPAAAKEDAEKSLLIASAGDKQIARKLFDTTGSAIVRLAAFLAITKDGADTALIASALKSEHAEIRHAAIQRAIELNLPTLVSGLEQSIAAMPLGDRMIVLGNIQHLESQQTAEKIALYSAASEDEGERIAALTALGKIGTKAAFDRLLEGLGERTPPVNQAATAALAKMDYPEAEPSLLAMLKGPPGGQKLLAIKAAAVRQIPGANEILIEIITGDDVPASREAMKTLYFTSTIDDLRALCAKAAATQDPEQRKSLVSFCSRIASRLKTPEALDLVKPLK